jgi:acyl CoA:acetate/3-ketoacid CoA transferase alpha subunit
MTKVYSDAKSALAGVLRDGMTILSGGFGLCGIPENLIAAIRESGAKDLTFVSNNAGVDDYGLGLLLQTRQVRKMIASYVGENKTFERQVLEGILEVELCPQGTLAEGKETRQIDGKWYVFEKPLHADIAIIKAWKGDEAGNLVYRKTARNFNPVMATAAKVTIAEVEHLVPTGDLDPDLVHTPGIYVKRLFKGTNYEKRIEQRTVRPKATAAV